ncbi:MAG: hypothetical protein JWN75_644 [Candidatus Saccharibacteria bacterium]|nr:hypothetical protein [Candidatus Saccharibacteria bacterium]
MDQVHKLEIIVARWYKTVPHLPKEFTKWLSDNIWWIVIIGVAISVISLLTLVPLVFFALGVTTVTSGVSVLSSAYGASYNGFFWFTVLVALLSAVAVTILEAMAIIPLKSKFKKGWTLLFIAALVSLASSVLTNLITMSIFGIVSAVLWAAVHGYFLFEIRSYFGASVKADRKPAVKAKV